MNITRWIASLFFPEPPPKFKGVKFENPLNQPERMN